MTDITRKITLAALAVFMLAPQTTNAAVYFIEKTDANYTRPAQQKPCNLRGYSFTIQKCKDNKTGGTRPTYESNYCPEDDKFFRACICDSTIYKYDASNCTNNRSLMDKSCMGKYETCRCDAKYKYNILNCPAPALLGNNKCGNTDLEIPKADECYCPANYLYTCTEPNLKGVGIACNAGTGAMYTNCECNPAQAWSTCPSSGTGDAPGGPAVGAGKCEWNSVVKYNNCCKCTGYHSMYAATDANADATEPCACNSGYIKATKCKSGYKPGNDGYCRPLTCNEALTELFAAESGYSDYAVYTGTTSSKATLVVGNDVSGNWSQFNGKTVTTGFSFAKGLSQTNNERRNVNTACKSVPSINMGTGAISSTTTVKDIMTTGTGNLTVNSGTFTCTNCSLNLGNFTVSSNASINLNALSGTDYTNYGNAIINASSDITITDPQSFSSSGYSYKANNLIFKFPNSVTRYISLYDNQFIKTTNLKVLSTTNSSTNKANISLHIYGPTNSNTAYVSGNLYLGTDGSNRSKNVNVVLRNEAYYLMYNPDNTNTTYSVTLTPGSSITHYDTNKYAIKRTSSTFWKKCEAANTQTVITSCDRAWHEDSLKCGGWESNASCANDDSSTSQADYYVACKINSSQTKSIYEDITYTKTSHRDTSGEEAPAVSISLKTQCYFYASISGGSDNDGTECNTQIIRCE